MKDIKWGKLFYCAFFGLLMSICIISFSIIVVLFVNLITSGFESCALIITFVLLVIGLTYWAYKNDVV